MKNLILTIAITILSFISFSQTGFEYFGRKSFDRYTSNGTVYTNAFFVDVYFRTKTVDVKVFESDQSVTKISFDYVTINYYVVDNASVIEAKGVNDNIKFVQYENDNNVYVFFRNKIYVSDIK